MPNSINIGIIGDFDENKPSHIATNSALLHAAGFLSIALKIDWLGTGNLRKKSTKDTIGQYQGLLAAPGTPYFFADGAVKGIKLAREMNIPFLGTCGGSQYTLLEFARNVANMTNAVHTELTPKTDMPLLIPVACTVDTPKKKGHRLEGEMKISVVPGTTAFKLYGKTEITESFACSYELNPEYKDRLVENGLTISGWSEDAKARIIELHSKRFFMGTGFLPQLNSTPENPHRIILAFTKAASETETPA
jgi:CTP synthase (UTP-ammonia lyase)